MKFNVTYTPKADLLQTLKDIADIKRKLIKKITSIKKFIKLDAPLFQEEEDLKALDLSAKTRPVTFDFGVEYNVGRMVLTHTNWLRDLLYRTNISNSEGLYIESSCLWRDIKQDPTSSSVKQELTFQFRVPEGKANDIAKTIAQDIYEFIFGINKEYKEKYDSRNSWPEFAEYISAQQLANEMPTETFRQRETDTILENHAFIFKGAGSKLFSGEMHSLIPAPLYDLKNFYQIILLDKVNSSPSKVASIAILASGQVLEDQLHLHDLSELLSNNFYANLIKEKDKIIEIKLNIPRIAMIVLDKGHIGEVQASVISNEVKNIKEKNGIKII